MKKAVFFEAEPWEQEYLKKNLKECEFKGYESRLTEKNVKLAKDAEILGVFVWDIVNKKILDKLPKLKLIVTTSTGFDHIDLKECKRRGITVCNVPSYGENTVAEHAMGLLLAVTRKIVESVNRTRKGNFNLEGLEGRDLKGKTIGILGTGNIGTYVCKYAKAFEMNVIACDKFPDKQKAKKIGFKYVSLNKLFKESDIISLHVPYCKETHHIINKKNVKKLKKGCIIINTARGKLIDTEALLLGLKKGYISGCGLDVLEEETAIKEEKELAKLSKAKQRIVKKEKELLKDKKVLVTPHNAFNTTEALTRIMHTTVENINKYLKGKAQNVVNK